MITNNFVARHNGPRKEEVEKMLSAIGVKTIDELIDKTVPKHIRLPKSLDLPDGLNEWEYLNLIKQIGAQNKIFKTYLGQGYYNTITPGVILRNILENPGWYTSYTPYQAEISQGRLEALLNFQTMVSDLTAMPIANASLLDEATAAGEAMIMFFNSRSREQVKNNARKLFVSTGVFQQTLAVLNTRALPLGIEIVTGCSSEIQFDETFFGAIIQYPDQKGRINDYVAFVEKAHQKNINVGVAADLFSLALLTPPGEWGADAVFGSTQRFGIPMGYGGPHAAFFAVQDKFKRTIPGRIIGVSVDVNGNRAVRMALQTREQHIKREKATSNICTAQALLAIMAGMYAVYHGPTGVKTIARHINILTAVLSEEISKLGYKQLNENYFDTVTIELPATVSIELIRKEALAQEINFRYISESQIGISIDETTSLADINQILSIFAKVANVKFVPYVCDPSYCETMTTYDPKFIRKSTFLTHPVFNSYHSETEMMRYVKMLEIKDLSLNRAMIPLGSCTMKLNAASELFYMSWPEFGAIHPFVPKDQAKGYQLILEELGKDLCKITGFAAISFQPNSGAAGEYAGLMAIREYHLSRGDAHRNIMLIPSSAHGTNPASSAMAGMDIIVVKSEDNGNVDFADLKEKTLANKDQLAGLMITYPSTHGVFEEQILDIINLIHENGGQVYMDGANMNAQVGLTSPGFMGADVCHLNLHKTFAIPHGGGGPGVGPIGVAKHLVEFLPNHCVVETGGKNGTPVSAAPYGSAFVIPISFGYVKLLGGEGLTNATKMAILNANYMMKRIEEKYKILYKGTHGTCAHEFIIDCNEFSLSADVQAIDIAKRLMDYGFHAPTVAFPVHGTLMVEPTESEPLSEMNRLCDALLAIHEEIKEIESGKADRKINVISMAPHTAEMVTADEWKFPYSRKKAAYPLPHTDKYWPTVTRIDDAFGDRNLMCTCQPIENYM